MQRSVYHSQSIQHGSSVGLQQQNSSLGLMQQAAWIISQQLIEPFNKNKIQKIAICVDKVITQVTVTISLLFLSKWISHHGLCS